MTFGGPAYLYEYSIGSGSLDRLELPPAFYNGFLSRVKIDAAGVVWVTEPYTLIRFDPSNGQMLTRGYPPADKDALVDVTSSHGDTGTWICAVAFDDQGNTLVGRHNVSSLTVVDQSLADVSRVPLPASYDGPDDLAVVGGAIELLPNLARVPRTAVIDEQGNLLREIPQVGVRFSVRGSRLVESGGLQAEWVDPSGKTALVDAAATQQTQSTTLGSIWDRAAITSDGGAVLYGRDTLSLIDSGGRVVSNLALPSKPILVTNPQGKVVQMNSRTRVYALAVDRNDRVWFVEQPAASAEVDLVGVDL